MTTIFDPGTRAAVIERIDRLRPDARPAWGTLSVSRMVAHLIQSLRMACGEVHCEPRGGPLSFPPLRWLVINHLPFPKGAPTSPRLLDRAPATELAEDRAVLVALLERVAARGPGGAFPRHPAFGVMEGRQWGVLIYRHADHHLRQFGV